MLDRIRRSPAQRHAWALIVAGCAGLLVVIPIAVWTHLGQRADERSRWSATIPDPLRLTYLEALNTVSIPVIVAGLLLAALVGAVRGRGDLVLAAAVVIGGANVTTQLGKAFLPRRDFGIGAENTLPSGHMTVITSLVLALVVVLPRLLRMPMVAVGTFVATTGGAAIVILRWHRPSDVVAAVGVLALWSGVAALVARWWRERRARDESASPVWNGPDGRGPRTDVEDRPGPAQQARADFAAHAVSARPWRDRLATYLVVALVSAAVAGGVLIAGGLVAFEERSNVLVAGFVLTVVAVVTAALLALAAAAFDGVDLPVLDEDREPVRGAAA